MSFLNPVNEPVLRFKSTDTGAPQINYNARVAGDVKTVLKGCLVTGYGAKASAGWSIVNEVDHVAEFVSPSAAMSDYRLGIDDTSTSSTTWYYQYQDARVNPTNNAPQKNISNINKASPDNAWQIIVTSRGLYFVEVFYSVELSALVSRTTFFGQLKASILTTNKNIGFWVTGHQSPSTYARNVFNTGTLNKHFSIGDYTDIGFDGANINAFSRSAADSGWGVSLIELIGEPYLSYKGRIIAQHTGLMLKDSNSAGGIAGVFDTTLGSRPVLQVCLGWSNSSNSLAECRVVLIYLDYWEY